MKKTDFNKSSPAFRVAVTGIFGALALTVSLIEKLVTANLMLPPGVKPGLSNVAVMLVCFVFGGGYALGIVLIKSVFALIISGAPAALFSLCGGLMSVAVMCLLRKLMKDKGGFIGISVAAAVFHNAGQLAAASVLVGSSLYLAYSPVLIVSGVVCGIITGLILSFVYPAIARIIK